MMSLLWLQQQHKGGKGSHQRSRKSEEVTSHGKKSKREKQREKQARKVCVYMYDCVYVMTVIIYIVKQ